MAAAVSTEGEMVYQVRDKPFDGTAMTAFLSLLLHSCEPQQQKVMVIWDNASIHNCAATHAFLSSDQHRQSSGCTWHSNPVIVPISMLPNNSGHT
jgi:hypothetical protein